MPSARCFVLLPAILLSTWILDPGAPIAGEPAVELSAEAAAEDPPAASSTGASRVIVSLRVEVTDAVLSELGSYGTVFGWIPRYRVVAMAMAAKRRALVSALPFVESVESDAVRALDAVGTWDRDLVDVTDVEESGVVGAPDPREVAQTGAGVHVAVIDTGLMDNWRDFLPEERVDTGLARAFLGGGVLGEDFVPVNELHISNPTDLWQHDTAGHGTAVASHVVGFKAGAERVDGAAPGATIVPLKVFPNGEATTFASRISAAIVYVTELVEAGVVRRAVINLSLSGGAPNRLEERVIDDAIAAGVILLGSAGNRGETGMGWPGAFPKMISVGAVGWTRQFQPAIDGVPNLGFWWTSDVGFDPDPRSGAAEESEAYVAPFSSRAIPARAQELDVLAPGSATVGPFLHGPLSGLFFISGTSFSTPLCAGLAALLLEMDPSLHQHEVEAILKSSARPMAATDERGGVFVLSSGAETMIGWDQECGALACDPVGAGLVQADRALESVLRRSGKPRR